MCEGKAKCLKWLKQELSNTVSTCVVLDAKRSIHASSAIVQIYIRCQDVCILKVNTIL